MISGVGGSLTGYNLFTYCGNDPINRSDSTGNWPRWITAKVATIGKQSGLLFMRRIGFLATVAFRLQSYHFDKRKELNDELPRKRPSDGDWKGPEDGAPLADCHQFSAPSGKPNIKCVSQDGHREAIYDYRGNLVEDPRDIGTYNFCPMDNTIIGAVGHFCCDILTWVVFGNNDDDPGPIINYFNYVTIRIFD